MIKWKILLWFFGGCTLFNLWAEFNQFTLLIYLSKPLLLTSLALFFYVNTKTHVGRFSWFIFSGLCFSILGDSILMLSENQSQSQHFFIWGLLSFLCTHICYLLAFLDIASLKTGWVRKNLWMALCALTLLFGNIGFLWYDLPIGLKAPVVIYSTVIIMMVLGCFNLKDRIPPSIFKGLLIGVLLFMISDNIIALNKFKSDSFLLFQPRLLIMSTYLLSQYLICTHSLNLSSISQTPDRIKQTKG